MTKLDNLVYYGPMTHRFKKGHPAKSYNVMEVADILGVHERTVRYWLKKGWVKAGKDYRNYPVFTGKDIAKIKEWRKAIRYS